MKYGEVQQSLEEWFQSQWAEESNVQYENVPFNSEMYSEYVGFHVLFGDSKRTTVSGNCYRVVGLVQVDVHVKPGIGTVRGIELAQKAAEMLTSKRVSATLPLVAPKVKMQNSSFYKSNREANGFIKYVVSCPFYYDLTLE